MTTREVLPARRGNDAAPRGEARPLTAAESFENITDRCDDSAWVLTNDTRPLGREGNWTARRINSGEPRTRTSAKPIPEGRQPL